MWGWVFWVVLGLGSSVQAQTDEKIRYETAGKPGAHHMDNYSYVGEASSGAPHMGFLWKPISEADKNLAILFPTETRERIERFGLFKEFPAAWQRPIDQGRYMGVGETVGYRPVWRFSKPGARYRGPLYATIRLKNGDEYGYRIKHTHRRIENVMPLYAKYKGSKTPTVAWSDDISPELKIHLRTDVRKRGGRIRKDCFPTREQCLKFSTDILQAGGVMIDKYLKHGMCCMEMGTAPSSTP
jgi:hypothetical protein